MGSTGGTSCIAPALKEAELTKLNPFQQRLLKICDGGKLTRSDIARWVGRRYATVNNWFVKGSAPSGPYASNVLASLTRLEDAIKKKKGFPVPESISYLERPTYIERLRDGQRRISKPRAPTKRVSDRRSDGAKPTEPETEDQTTLLP